MNYCFLTFFVLITSLLANSVVLASNGEWHWYKANTGDDRWEIKEGLADVVQTGDRLFIQFYVSKKVLPGEPREAPKKLKGSAECLWPYIDGTKVSNFSGNVSRERGISGHVQSEDSVGAVGVEMRGRLYVSEDSSGVEDFESIILSEDSGRQTISLFRMLKAKTNASTEIGHSVNRSNRVGPCPAWLK